MSSTSNSLTPRRTVRRYVEQFDARGFSALVQNRLQRLAAGRRIPAFAHSTTTCQILSGPGSQSHRITAVIVMLVIFLVMLVTFLVMLVIGC